MKVTFRIQRYNPEKDAKPYFQDFTLDGLEGTYRVLDALHDIKWKHDGTLTFRRSCAHGMCGSDGMKINGRNTLACSLLLQDIKGIGDGKVVTIEPLPYLPIIKDLVIDTTDFFKKYELVKPYLIVKTPPPEMERYQSNEDAELSYEIPSDGNVRITITDPLGREIRTVQTGFISAGKHSISIDESMLSGGTYFIRINAHGITAFQKFIVIK